jgi:hypothetical protein
VSITLPSGGFLQKPSYPVFNPAHPLARGLQGAWLFTERGTTETAFAPQFTVRDHSTNHFDGLTYTLVGHNVEGNDGLLGRCGFFDGSTAVAIPYNAILRVASPYGYTISAWVRIDANVNFYYIMGQGANGSNEPITLRCHGSDIELFSGSTGGDITLVMSGGNSNPKEWMHLVGIISANSSTVVPKYTLIKNGGTSIVKGTGAGNFSYTNTEQFVIGDFDNSGGIGGRAWVGNIDSVMVWTRELSIQEAQMLYQDQYAMFRIPLLFKSSFTPRFRKTLSLIGSHVGGRGSQIS